MRGHGLRLAVLVLAILVPPLAADEQEAAKVPRIGVLGPAGADLYESFRQGLREFGYQEGRNIAVEYRFAEGRFDRLPDLVAELIRLKVEVIVTDGWGIPAAKQATSTIPIVIAVSDDPVARGWVTNLRRPGGNITGLSFMMERMGNGLSCFTRPYRRFRA